MDGLWPLPSWRQHAILGSCSDAAPPAPGGATADVAARGADPSAIAAGLGECPTATASLDSGAATSWSIPAAALADGGGDASADAGEGDADMSSARAWSGSKLKSDLAQIAECWEPLPFLDSSLLERCNSECHSALHLWMDCSMEEGSINGSPVPNKRSLRDNRNSSSDSVGTRLMLMPQEVPGNPLTLLHPPERQQQQQQQLQRMSSSDSLDSLVDAAFCYSSAAVGELPRRASVVDTGGGGWHGSAAHAHVHTPSPHAVPILAGVPMAPTATINPFDVQRPQPQLIAAPPGVVQKESRAHQQHTARQQRTQHQPHQQRLRQPCLNQLPARTHSGSWPGTAAPACGRTQGGAHEAPGGEARMHNSHGVRGGWGGIVAGIVAEASSKTHKGAAGRQ